MNLSALIACKDTKKINTLYTRPHIHRSEGYPKATDSDQNTRVLGVQALSGDLPPSGAVRRTPPSLQAGTASTPQVFASTPQGGIPSPHSLLVTGLTKNMQPPTATLQRAP